MRFEGVLRFLRHFWNFKRISDEFQRRYRGVTYALHWRSRKVSNEYLNSESWALTDRYISTSASRVDAAYMLHPGIVLLKTSFELLPSLICQTISWIAY